MEINKVSNAEGTYSLPKHFLDFFKATKVYDLINLDGKLVINSDENLEVLTLKSKTGLAKYKISCEKFASLKSGEEYEYKWEVEFVCLKQKVKYEPFKFLDENNFPDLSEIFSRVSETEDEIIEFMFKLKNKEV